MSRDQVIFERTVQEALRRAKLLFTPRAGNQSSTGNASSTQAGLVPPVPADATKFLNGATPPAYAQVKGADLSMSDVVTNNVTIAQHGFAPKLPNDGTKYLDGTGAYSVPAGGSSGGAPPLGVFPTITGLTCRISAELSTITRATDNRVSQINDMTGNGFHFTASASARPRWHATAYNDLRPGLIFDGSTTKMISAIAFTLPQPLTVVMVLENWGKTGSANLNLFRDATFNAVVFISGGQWAIFSGGTTVLSSALYLQNQEAQRPGREGAPAIMQAVFNGASSVLANNGVEITGNPGTTQSINGLLTIGGDPSTSIARLNLYEMLLFNKALSLVERQSLNTYYANACNIHL